MNAITGQNLANNDLWHVVDVSEANNSNKNKRITTSEARSTLLKGIIDQIDGHDVTPGNKTYYIRSYAFYPLTINSLSISCASGSSTAAVKVNNEDVTGLSSVAVTSTPSLTLATGANAVTVGQEITIVTTAASSPTDLRFSLSVTRS